MRTRIVAIISVVFLLSLALHAELTPEQRKQAETLIGKFTARAFAERQQAVDDLVRMGKDVLPLIEKTRKDTADGEVQLRCEMVIKALTRNPGSKAVLEQPMVVIESAEALVEKLRLEDPVERDAAVEKLALMGPAVTPLMEQTIKDARDEQLKDCCRKVLALITAPGTQRAAPIAVPKGDDVKSAQEFVIGDFEDGISRGWGGQCGARATITESKHAHGKRWLRVDMPQTDKWWPGGHVYYGATGGDWSGYRAVRYTVYNPYGETFPHYASIYDITSGDYFAAYPREAGLTLRPGINEFEMSIGSMKAGIGRSRGIDVRRIRVLWIFLDRPRRPYTFYIDNVRLVPPNPDAPKRVLLADFDGHGAAGWKPWRMGEVALKRQRGDAALEVSFPKGLAYPGVEFSGFDADWLSYDTLSMDVTCPENRPTPDHLCLELVGSDGIQQRLAARLGKGMHHLRVPLELNGLASLGRMKSLALTVQNAAEDKVVLIDNVRLERVDRLVYGGRIDPAETLSGALNIDMGKVDQRMDEAEARDIFAPCAIVWVPMKSGETRVYHCSPMRSTAAAYALDAELFKDAKPDAPVEVWAYLRARGQWYWQRREVRLDADKPVTIDLNDRAAFGWQKPVMNVP